MLSKFTYNRFHKERGGLMENRKKKSGNSILRAAVVAVSVPLILLFLIFHKKIMAGVARGGVKG